MEKKQEAKTDISLPDWGTASARVAWLVEHRFGGNRSAFASSVGVSHTAINKIVSGQRQPGRKLLSAIVENLHVRSDWLLRGEGQPFAEATDLAASGLPVTRVLLPGPPLESQGLLSGERVDLGEDVFSPSRYWLILAHGQPLLRDATVGFKVNDKLLMETDHAKFPREEKLWESLCVVRFAKREETLKLASVSYYQGDGEGDAPHLVADTFEIRPDPAQMIRQDVYTHRPGGEIEYRQRYFQSQEAGTQRLVPAELLSGVFPNTIRYTDIVAVWMGVIIRA